MAISNMANASRNKTVYVIVYNPYVIVYKPYEILEKMDQEADSDI